MGEGPFFCGVIGSSGIVATKLFFVVVVLLMQLNQ